MRDHTSLLAWREANIVALAAVNLNTKYWKPPAGHIFSQLLRSSLSVQLNIAEGYAFTDSPSFLRHLRIAYGSAVETADLLNLLVQSRTVGLEPVSEVLGHCRRSQKLLMGLIRRQAGKR
ncbi:MAG TPA: four helix bundle protein [Gemmatimonadales bacterium]|nr:four helix bundle protein [Gemmatimonadales bacterium]